MRCKCGTGYRNLCNLNPWIEGTQGEPFGQFSLEGTRTHCQRLYYFSLRCASPANLAAICRWDQMRCTCEVELLSGSILLNGSAEWRWEVRTIQHQTSFNSRMAKSNEPELIPAPTTSLPLPALNLDTMKPTNYSPVSTFVGSRVLCGSLEPSPPLN